MDSGFPEHLKNDAEIYFRNQNEYYMRKRLEKLEEVAKAASELFKPHESLELKYKAERILYEKVLKLEKD